MTAIFVQSVTENHICQPQTTLQLLQAMAQPLKPVTELRR